MATVTVDFVAKDFPQGGWGMILVEQGPWQQDHIEANLQRLQDRLYSCIDSALEGKLAEQFPDSIGKSLLIRVNAFNLPEQQTKEFFNRFSTSVMQLPDYAAALAASTVVPSIDFELNLERI